MYAKVRAMVVFLRLFKSKREVEEAISILRDLGDYVRLPDGKESR